MKPAPANEARVFILIAAFQEEQVIGRVVEEVRQRYPVVVVVDDGSSDRTAAHARAAGAIVLRHVVNRGQGAALQTGLSYALSNEAEYIVTFDADGQHHADEIPSLLEPLRRGNAEIVLGSRFLGRTENMPIAKRIVLRCGVLFTRLVSRIEVTDTHNGFRAFTRRAASRLSIGEDRMAHASEILDQVAGCGLPYLEVPVTIRYTDYSVAKGQSVSASLRILFDYLSRKLLGPA